MSRTFDVVTPEQVAIRYELAGFGSRALAALIDSGFQALILLVVLLIALFFYIADLAAVENAADLWEQVGSSVLVGVLLLIVFVISWGYYIAFETLWNGSTPGKRIMHLRVIKDGGHPVDFRAVVTRNLLRAVDMLPGAPPLIPLYGFAFIATLWNDQYKRLGDMAAGTLVVRHSDDDDPFMTLNFGKAVVYRLLDATNLSQLSRLSRDEYRMVQRFLEQRDRLPLALRTQFARQLALPLMEKLSYRESELGSNYERWLDELDLAYRTRALGPITTTVATPTPVVATPTPTPEPLDTRKW